MTYTQTQIDEIIANAPTDRNCIKCGAELKCPDNWSYSQVGKCNYICKDCFTAYSQTRSEQLAEYHNKVTTNKKRIQQFANEELELDISQNWIHKGGGYVQNFSYLLENGLNLEIGMIKSFTSDCNASSRRTEKKNGLSKSSLGILTSQQMEYLYLAHLKFFREHTNTDGRVCAYTLKPFGYLFSFNEPKIKIGFGKKRRLMPETKAKKPSPDHLFARSNGGQNIIENICFVTLFVNQTKSDMMLSEYLDVMPGIAFEKSEIISNKHAILDIYDELWHNDYAYNEILSYQQATSPFREVERKIIEYFTKHLNTEDLGF